ncbi:phage gp45-like [Agrobacterium vitis]|nr:phage gp45-like [Agrobacterium vitis]MBE1437085.1 phage gp45-like [Agrobacterium vitis]
MSGFTRIELDGRVVEKAGYQQVSGRGMYGDGWSQIYRPEPHGFASSPVAGAKGIIIPDPRNPDMAFMLGGEHASHRPGNLPGGGVALYDSSGNILKFIGTGLVIDVPGRTVTATCGTWKIVGNFEVDGNIHTTGNITASGTITDSDGNNGA